MKFGRRKLSIALAGMTSLGGALTLVVSPAKAANVVVEITGSNIKRAVNESALPVQTITREEIAKSGAQTAYEILEHVSAVMAFGSVNEALSSRPQVQSLGFAGLSLRGLGIDKALILLDGRRIASYALAYAFTGVDLNSIPTAVIDRVEILKDGASAIYGADAIAGVINFITRKDFTGAEVFGYYASPQDSGGAQKRATVSAGYGDLTADKFNAWISFDYLNNQRMVATDRAFSRTSYRPDLGVDRTAATSYPANVTIPGVRGPRNPTDPTPDAPDTVLSPVCLPPLSFPTIASPHQCRYGASFLNNILDPSTRYNVFGRLTWQINTEVQLFGEGSYTRNQFTNAITESMPDAAVTMLPASSPYYPTAWLQANYPAAVGEALPLSWRTVEMGQRENATTSEQMRALAGLKGSIKGWDYEAAYNFNRSKASNSYTNGFLDARIFTPLVNSGVVNPFGPNTPEVLAQMHAADVRGEITRATGTIQSIDAKASADVAQLAAGPLSLALGGEYRKEDLTQWRAPVRAEGYIVGPGGTIPAVPPSDRTVGSLFAEAYIPIVRGLDVQAAVRFDDYSDFGSTTNWRLALRWQPARQILFRGSWNTGFRPPSLIELYQPLILVSTMGAFSDPLRCPVTQSSITDCRHQFRVQRGGDPALQPETSKQWSLGVVLDPADGLSMSFDWFRIELQDVLAQRSEAFLEQAMKDPNSPYVRRGPIDLLYPDIPGPVEYLIGPTQNLGQRLVEGIDADLIARSPKTPYGQFNARFNGTYFMQYRQSLDDGSFPNLVGTRGDVGSIPRWKYVLTLDWTNGPWNATLIENYTHSYVEPCVVPTPPATFGDPSGCTTRKVAAYETWDLSGAYTGFTNLTLRLGIKNLMNRDPPTSNQQLTAHIGYDPSYADPRGRTFYGSVRYVFK